MVSGGAPPATCPKPKQPNPQQHQRPRLRHASRSPGTARRTPTKQDQGREVVSGPADDGEGPGRRIGLQLEPDPFLIPVVGIRPQRNHRGPVRAPEGRGKGPGLAGRQASEARIRRQEAAGGIGGLGVPLGLHPVAGRGV